jgi:hypothetical protein
MIPAAVVCGAAQTKVFRILADLNHRILYITCFRSLQKKALLLRFSISKPAEKILDYV